MDRITVRGKRTIVSNNIVVNVVGTTELLFDWLRGGEVIVNNKSAVDCIITASHNRLIATLNTYTIEAGVSVNFVYEDGEYYVKTITGLTQDNDGDMYKSTFDPTNVYDDVFDMDNMTEGTNKILTAAERSAITANTAKVTYPSADSTKLGLLSITSAVDLDVLNKGTANLDVAVSRSLAITDLGKTLVCSNSGAITLTLPDITSVVGNEITVLRNGAGSVTFVASSTTINSVSGDLAILNQYSMAVLKKTTTSTWVLVGSLG
jgi:hypothetical protein